MRTTTLEAGAGALAEYYQWFADARLGDVLVYHRGDLQFDRDPGNFPGLDTEAKDRMAGLDALAFRIQEEARAGFLILNQKKLGESIYEYRAVRRLSPIEAQLMEIKKRDASVHA